MTIYIYMYICIINHVYPQLLTSDHNIRSVINYLHRLHIDINILKKV